LLAVILIVSLHPFNSLTNTIIYVHSRPFKKPNQGKPAVTT
jgi:hypothetical protein